MATDLEQLQVTLSAKIGEFQSSMRQAGSEFDAQASRIEGRNKQLTDTLSGQMQSVGAGVTFLANSIKGLLSVAAIEQLIAAMGRARESLASLSRQADETRLSVEQIAALRFVGAGFGVSADEMSKALAAFTEQSKKTQEDARGLYKAFDQIGPSFRNAFAQAESQPQRLEILSRAVRSTTDETKRFQLAQQAGFGDSERMLAVLDNLNGNFSTLVERARAAGISIDTDLAQKADEAEKKLAVLKEVISDKLTVGLARLGDLITATIVPAFSSLIPFLETTAREINSIVYAFNLLSAAADLFASTGHIPAPGATREYLQALESTQPGGQDEPPARDLTVHRGAYQPRTDPQKKPAAASEDEYDREVKHIKKQITALTGQEAALGKVGEAAAKAEASARLSIAAEEAGLPITDALTAKIDKLADAYAKVKSHRDALALSKDLDFEREQLGRTPDEAAVQARLRSAGVDPEKDVDHLADKMRNLQNLTEGKEMAGSFVKGLVSDLENGVKAGQALENQLKRIAEKLADKAIDSLISGLFGAATGKGGLFSTVFQSEGGWAGQGPRSQVPSAAFIGAQQFAAGGGIPAILHAGEIVLNQAQQKNVAQGLGPGKPITITHAPTINGTGMTTEQVFAFVQRSQKEFARNIGPVLNDWQRRHG